MSNLLKIMFFIFFIFCCQLVFLPVFSFSAPTPQIDTANWMKSIPSDRTINSLVIPATHDTGMYMTKHCTLFVFPEWTQTQALSIFDQLMVGTRYFDIRVDYDHNELVTYHRTDSSGCNGDSLKNILDAATQFLSLHPSEVIIIKFSHTRDDWGHNQSDITKKVINLLETTYHAYLYVSDFDKINLSSLQLAQTRGKIIAVFDKEYQSFINPHLGIFNYQDYNHSGNLTVYDQFSDTSDYKDMMDDQITKLKKYAGLNQSYLFLLSWTLTGEIFALNLKELADQANSHLSDELYDLLIKQKLPKPNFVYIDFIDKKLALDILQYNFL